MTRIYFDEVSVIAVKKWIDETGRKRQKTKKFYQTLNPYNQNVHGVPKSRVEIMNEIMAERKSWLESDSKE